MIQSMIFRRQLAARILAAIPLAGCTGGYGGVSASGGGSASDTTHAASHGTQAASASAATSSASTSGAGGATGAGGAWTGAGGGGTGGSIPQDCFPWTSGACPLGGSQQAMDQFMLLGCPDGGAWEPSSTIGLVSSSDNQCCYTVTNVLCALAGRPFLVDDEARVAPAVFGATTSSWHADRPPAVDGLPEDDRASLAAAWTGDALLEHASVASFSRLSLALLAAGAPADLVDETHRAASDEVKHAKLCFSLASRYAGDGVGPGGFPIGGAVRVPTTLADIAVSTVLEGCVGETVAAVVAAEQLARATDARVREALAVIAADEARHAELAWRIVAWAVQAGGPTVERAAARALFDSIAGSCLEQREGSASRPPRTSLEAHGRLDTDTVAEVTRRAITEVVAPAAWALFHAPDVSDQAACS